MLLAVTAWGALAWYVAGPGSDGMRLAVAGLVALLGVASIAAPARYRRPVRVVLAVAIASLAIWWHGLEPSNDRDWKTEVAVQPWATIEGDRVTVHNVRNFKYRSVSDFDVAYYDKTYLLSELTAVDLAAIYWMGPDIAHIIVSFGFANGDQLAFSIETRTERGEGYSTVRGFFRQYEIFYVVADERDVIGVRANHRRDPTEDVYLYRLQAPIANGRRLFLDYLHKINALKDHPEWYNTLTTNCTTNVWLHSGVNPEHPPFSWKLLASGHVPEYLYEHGRVVTGLPFEELRTRSLINPRAQAAGNAGDFSRRIREGLPGITAPSRVTAP